MRDPVRTEAHPFQLEHGEVAARHVPATMAGGVAVFDYNRDGRPDIFFTNGANLATLKKDDPKYRNRLFRNDGNGVNSRTSPKRRAGRHGLRQRRGGGRLR
jgi:enediyne biosynthesis protein E4